MLSRIAFQYQRWSSPATKAINYKPDLAGREHLLSVSASTEQKIDSYADYAKIYNVYSWVRRAVGIIVDATSTLPVDILDGKNMVVAAHPLTALLKMGNDTQEISELFSLWTINMMLAGEAFLEIVNDGKNRPVELWNRRPDFVGVIPDTNREDFPKPAGYRYVANGSTSARVIEPERMIHSRFVNPLNDWRGIAPIAAAREGIIIDLYSQQWSKNFLKHNARPDFAIIAPQGVTASERERYLSEFTRRNQGNMHLPVMLEQGVTDIKPFSFAPKDIEWLAQRKFSREEVAVVFGIPEEILGFGRDTFENYRTAWEVTWTLTLLPLLRRRDAALTTHFRRYTNLLKDGERIETDVSSVDVLNEDMMPRAQVAKQYWDMGVPFNVLDERLGLGIGAVPGGDVGWGKASQVASVSGVAVNEQAAEAARLRRWAARRKNPRAADFQSDILSDAQKAAIIGEVDQTSEVSTDNGFFSGIVTRRAVDPDPDGEMAERLRIERRAERQIAAGLATQQERVLAMLPETADDFTEWARHDLEEALRRQPTEDELYDMLRRALVQSVDLGVAAAVAQMETVGIGFDWTLANEEARQWADRYVGELITDIDATTLRRVRAAVEQWIVNGEPLERLIEDLTPIFGGQRAELIASTEVTRSYAEANRQAYRQAGMRYIRWNTAADERVCPICGPLNGQVVGIDARFDDALPDDVREQFRNTTFEIPPAHPRCRCWLTTWVE
jgi:HK97 family phage portal protein